MITSYQGSMVAESRQRKKEWGRPTVVSTGTTFMQCWGFSKKLYLMGAAQFNR